LFEFNFSNFGIVWTHWSGTLEWIHCHLGVFTLKTITKCCIYKPLL